MTSWCSFCSDLKSRPTRSFNLIHVEYLLEQTLFLLISKGRFYKSVKLGSLECLYSSTNQFTRLKDQNRTLIQQWNGPYFLAPSLLPAFLKVRLVQSLDGAYLLRAKNQARAFEPEPRLVTPILWNKKSKYWYMDNSIE